jgi:hypothetical protein
MKVNGYCDTKNIKNEISRDDSIFDHYLRVTFYDMKFNVKTNT